MLSAYAEQPVRAGCEYLISFTRPQSITQTTSSIVMEVSATLVATTILRCPDLTLSNTLVCTQHQSSGQTSTHSVCCCYSDLREGPALKA